MVSHVTALDSRKRKKTTEMADSPPKRVTRARAKVTEDSELEIKTTKITTASARVAAKSKATTKATTTTKRKTKAKDLEPITAEASGEASPLTIAEPPKSRGRPKKALKEAKVEVPLAEMAPNSRTRKEKAVEEEVAVEVVKPRSRARKAVFIASASNDQTRAEVPEPDPVVKATRTRSTRTKPDARSTTNAPALRKKVTFQDEAQDDKENVAIPSESKKKIQSKPAGIKAKPVRKPATVRGTLRGKKAAITKEPRDESKGNDEVIQPLSPKKVTQVAKTSSISSEDELCGEKSASKSLSRSPMRPPMSPRKEQTANTSLLGWTSAVGSPPKLSTSSIMASPARRAPPSPFKDALKESPKKVVLESGAVDTMTLPSEEQLKKSPKKINFGSTIVQSVFAPSQTPLKGSLLRSPARRPMTAFKPKNHGSLDDTAKIVPATVGKGVSKSSISHKPLSFTPSRLFTSALRAGQSTETPVKVHAITAAELQSRTPLGDEEQNMTRSVGVEGAFDHEAPPEQIRISDPVKALSPAMPQSFIISPKKSTERMATYEVEATEPMSDELHEQRSTTPPNEPIFEAANPFSLSACSFRQVSEDSDSEDELQSASAVHSKSLCHSRYDMTVELRTDGTPTPGTTSQTPSNIVGHQVLQRQSHSLLRSAHRSGNKAGEVSITPLALQLSSWLASSPEKRNLKQAPEQHRGIFYPLTRAVFSQSEQPENPFQSGLPQESALFEDEMVVRDQENVARAEESENEPSHEIMVAEASQDSQDSEEYGDENAVPIDPRLLDQQHVQESTLGTCTPARVFQVFPREIRTVSKVPLRPEGQDSPLKIPRKRSRSASGPLMDMKDVAKPSFGRSNTVISYSLGDNFETEQQPECVFTPAKPSAAEDSTFVFPTTPSESWSTFATPARTVRKGADAQILRGAVVFVDVHTSEGADASGIFVELLTQMGAKCIKQWTWNPRASSSKAAETPSPDQNVPLSESTPSGKVGITHVVYKDGGRRTLERVRESKGLVLCVGVSWVLDCERENKWLDEVEYAIDTSLVPRGGHNRRKSMEPRMLANVNGNLVPAETSAKPSFDLSPTKEFLNLSSPVSRRESSVAAAALPETPRADGQVFGEGASSWGSPTTPYYLSEGAKLLQQTCPPKQTMQSLFPLSGRIEDQPDETVRQRLLLARRKSLQWAPKIASPLGRAMSYGK